MSELGAIPPLLVKGGEKARSNLVAARTSLTATRVEPLCLTPAGIFHSFRTKVSTGAPFRNSVLPGGECDGKR
jgi:hypothetical protein